MHEISLVQGLLQQLADLAVQNNRQKVTKITMEIGPLSGVVADSFTFGFDILSQDNDLVKNAVLDIIVPSVTYRCSECGHAEVTDGEKPEQCAKCQDLFLLPEGGDDLILKQVEME